VPLPRWLARSNRVGFNRVSRHFASRLPGFGVVHHEGRRTGKPYATPVNVFRRTGGYAIALTYGRESEWTRNVLSAGGAVLTTRGRDRPVANPREVHSPAREWVPAPVRVVLRVLGVEWFLLVDPATG
jgi:deazaflavin-dependent oxidoreductase (nitroreductase family)